MNPSSALLAFGTMVLGAAVAVAQPIATTAQPAASRSDCSAELARQSIARMQRQAQPEGRVGSDCLARQNAMKVESAAKAEPVKVADAGSASQQ
jgi:hypothetical protein